MWLYYISSKFNTYKPNVLLWDRGKQYRPGSDATECGVWSGSPLFACGMFYKNWITMKNTTQHPLNQKWTVSIDNYGTFIHLKWVKDLCSHKKQLFTKNKCYQHSHIRRLQTNLWHCENAALASESHDSTITVKQPSFCSSARWLLIHLRRMEFPTIINSNSPFLWGPWSDAVFCGVWSGSALFAYVPQKRH